MKVGLGGGPTTTLASNQKRSRGLSRLIATTAYWTNEIDGTVDEGCGK